MAAAGTSRLGLGTVQFGLDYGVANPDGRTTPEEARRILAVASANGIGLVDTACVYGESERILGEILPAGDRFRIVTKTPAFGGGIITGREADGVEQAFLESLHLLGRPAVYGLLVHHSEDLLAPGGHLLFKRLEDFKKRGLVTKIGVSSYTPAQADRAMSEFDVELIQAPLNVLDQRLLQGGQLERMRARGIEFHARSVFLQGLLSLAPERLPCYFAPWREHLERYRLAAAAAEMEPLTLALRFVLDQPQVAVAVCGVNRADQLVQLLEASRGNKPLPPVAAFALDDPSILDPSRWQT